MLTLLTAKCGFRLPHHSFSAWSLCILQTSIRQIRARLTCLGLIGHALFCPQILSGRKGESEDILYLYVGFLGVQWPIWKYNAVATPCYSVSSNPRHCHSICTDLLQTLQASPSLPTSVRGACAACWNQLWSQSRINSTFPKALDLSCTCRPSVQSTVDPLATPCYVFFQQYVCQGSAERSVAALD